MIAEVIMPQILALIAYSNIKLNLVTLLTSICATLAVVGTQETPAIPTTDVYKRQGMNGCIVADRHKISYNRRVITVSYTHLDVYKRQIHSNDTLRVI